MPSDSDSDSDSDVQAVQRNRRIRQKQQQQFNDRDASSSPAPTPPPQTNKPTARRPLPRFLGDDLDEDGNIGTDDLFTGLEDVPNARPPARRDAFDEIDEDDEEGGSTRKGKSLTTTVANGLDGLDPDNVGGLDVDGVVKKKRKPIAKMDDNRLMGPNGFPKLRSASSAFRPRGKGYEVKDLKRLMSLYQLWAHQMYPKTNLRDTLQTVEKLCHKRSMQRALKSYRDEAKLERSRAAALLDPDPEDLEGTSNINAPEPSLAEFEPETIAMKKQSEEKLLSEGASPEPEPNEEDMYGFELDEEAERMMLEFKDGF